MILKIKIPNEFVPTEIEFQMYCAIKLLKGKYISKEEAMKMCGLQEINEINNTKFDQIYTLLEKRYIKMCGYGYADSDFIDDMQDEINRKNKNN